MRENEFFKYLPFLLLPQILENYSLNFFKIVIEFRSLYQYVNKTQNII